MGMIAKHRLIWLILVLPLLCLPMIGSFVSTPATDTEAAAVELRWPQTAAGWLALPRATDGWLQAHFGFRATLLDTYARLRYAIRSPTTDRVVFGRDGWLFLTDDAVFQQSMGKRMRVSLVAQFADTAQALQRELKARGATLVVAVPPNSQSINRDALPRWARVSPARTEYDELADDLRDRGVPFVDLRTMLRDEKQHQEVYLKTDTHWNNHGALLSFNEIMRASGRRDWQVDPSLVERGFQRIAGGDLARMIGVGRYLDDRQMSLDLDAYKPALFTVKDLDDRDVMPTMIVTRAGASKSASTVMVIGDSFTREHFRDLIMLHATRLIWTHHNQCAFNWGLIETYKPDLVILAPTERYALCAPGRSPVGMPESADKVSLELSAGRTRLVVP